MLLATSLLGWDIRILFICIAILFIFVPFIDNCKEGSKKQITLTCIVAIPMLNVILHGLVMFGYIIYLLGYFIYLFTGDI